MAELGDLVAEVASGEVRRRPVSEVAPAGAGRPVSEAAPDAISAPRAKPQRIVMPTRVRPRPLGS